MNDLRILIIEDEPMIAEDIAMILEQAEYEVAGIVYEVEEALKILNANNTDLVLLDINLNGQQEGLAIAAMLKTKYKVPFVFITSYSDKETINTAKLTEPCGYIVKPFSEAGLLATIEVAMVNFAQRNRGSLSELNFENINSRLSSPLSDREEDVLKLIYEGKTNQQISTELFVSINTIKKHINNSYLKIDATTRSNAIARLRQLSAK